MMEIKYGFEIASILNVYGNTLISQSVGFSTALTLIYAVLFDTMVMIFPFYEFEKHFNCFMETKLFQIQFS